jgi:hypothetical protein
MGGCGAGTSRGLRLRRLGERSALELVDVTERVGVNGGIGLQLTRALPL